MLGSVTLRIGARRKLRGLDAAPSGPEAEIIAACEKAREQVATSGASVGDAFEIKGSDRRIPIDVAITDSAPPDKGLGLYRLVRRTKTTRVVEFGAAFGVSGSYLSCAIRDNRGGRLISIEASATRREIAQATCDSIAPGIAEVRCSLFEDAYGALDGAQLFFLDGNHYSEPTAAYLDQALSRMSRPAWIVLDDIVHYSEEMSEAWERLQRDDRFAVKALSLRMGILVAT